MELKASIALHTISSASSKLYTGTDNVLILSLNNTSLIASHIKYIHPAKFSNEIHLKDLNPL